MAAFAVLIGTWDTEATHPELEGVIPGVTVYEWLAGERFLIGRAQHDHPQVPDSIAVIGPPESGAGLVMEYFDSRGVRRTYEVSLQDGVLRTWRDAPGFEQRSSAELAPDGFTSAGELARAPGDWRPDLQVTYRRRA